MPAARPAYDALSVWLTVVAEFGEERGVRDGAFLELHRRTRKHFQQRGQERVIDLRDGVLLGETLSREHLEKLFYIAQNLIAADASLEAEMRDRAGQLAIRLKDRPGSYLLPFRPRSARRAAALDTWIVLHFCPSEEEMFFIAAHGIDLELTEADHPDGPFLPI